MFVMLMSLSYDMVGSYWDWDLDLVLINANIWIEIVFIIVYEWDLVKICVHNWIYTYISFCFKTLTYPVLCFVYQ